MVTSVVFVVVSAKDLLPKLVQGSTVNLFLGGEARAAAISPQLCCYRAGQGLLNVPGDH